MGIGGINQNKATDVDVLYKNPVNDKVKKSAEGNNLLGQKENSEIEVENAVSKINKLLEGEGTHLQYEKHDVFNEMIIRVIDNNTNQVLNEIPSKKILDMVAKMCEMAGILVDKKA
ncbi:flagellar protein FlaG [Clostridium estertheticum]|uniref:flagellar protein FlaG n=1 Tax=Clostridium estertheticum TaxID=238834 RepID=UPI001CF385B9|nr:flagellar protein FlaG [Clostridium estertheticum]MCB2308800.1 flagellar protein FlaG [Clostridium estertheticum]MCB2347122.1 flagellar protein FlaG [Clostridium estertheticum]MCB2351786.1 flagellar protein FlaG [Clostridium estertheticum]WAG44492.1 flagellar protein FlaG [Clostridium estertheticum]